MLLLPNRAECLQEVADWLALGQLPGDVVIGPGVLARLLATELLAHRGDDQAALVCPIAALEAIVGAEVIVEHNGTTLYVIDHAGTTLLGFAEHRTAQATAVSIAALLLMMAGLALWRA